MGGAGAFSDEPGFFPGLKGDLPSPLDNIVLPGVEPKRFQYVEVPHANRLGGGAVSYTHLTLPTIYSV